MPKALTSDNGKYAIQNVRKLAEAEEAQYIPQLRGRLFFSDGPALELPGLSWTDLTEHKSDGSYVSGSTIVYLISDEEEQTFIALSSERETVRKAVRAAEQAAYKVSIAKRSFYGPRLCPRCHSYCYGDCRS